MEIKKLKELLIKFEKNIVYNQDLKKKNWFNIGGKTKVFYKAEELKDLIDFLKIINNREKVFVIGAGSNTLITDDLYDGIVIKLGKNFNRLSLLKKDIIISGAGVLDRILADFAADNGLGGFEFLACIPGTIGGGIKMNAGCFGSEIKDILVSVQAIDKTTGNVLTQSSNDDELEEETVDDHDKLQKDINEDNKRSNDVPEPDDATSKTQKVKGKSGFCYIGEDRGFRSCIEVNENDTCMSGDIFPTEQICINPSLREGTEKY